MAGLEPREYTCPRCNTKFVYTLLDPTSDAQIRCGCYASDPEWIVSAHAIEPAQRGWGIGIIAGGGPVFPTIAKYDWGE